MIDIENPLVSVIVPAYNHEAWVKETILSIVNQSYDYNNIQLIVTDDCSTDNTPIILKELAALYNFELIIHNTNKGISSTLNEMISISKGKYITGIASDDIMFLDKIENQVNILNNNPDIDILAGNCTIIDKDGKIIYPFLKISESTLTTYSFEDLFLRLKPGFPAGSVIIKSNLYKSIGTYDPNYKIEDYYFWLKAAYNNARIVKCNMPFIYYRLNQSSLSSNYEFMIKEEIKILNIYADHINYPKAIRNLNIRNLYKLIFISRGKAISYLIRNPHLIIDRKTIKLIIMLIIPNYFLKRKFHENYSRIAT